MDRNRQKYVELSLAGKWVCMAREIILDNPGITESKFIEIAAPLMPTHIKKDDENKVGQVRLAIESIRHLVKVHKAVLLIDGKLTSKPRDVLIKGYSKEIVEFASKNETVQATDLPHIKYFATLASQLCKRNVLKRIRPGRFAVKEVQNGN